ncbi:hypothetical protein KGM_204930 [Danaus plexippus plexippus]|uniref:Uncharacterized protein n=1 Tax=Danaus plexippus plexippus TaxID=278856 RepID=A0A212F8W9_DANPL|nr:hypothetical protein KGM_204930 [Danaus plexippus plexippus]
MRVTVWPAGSLEDRPPPDPTSPGSPDTRELGSGLCREQTNPLGNVRVPPHQSRKREHCRETAEPGNRKESFPILLSYSPLGYHVAGVPCCRGADEWYYRRVSCVPRVPANKIRRAGSQRTVGAPAPPPCIRARALSHRQMCQESPEAPLTHAHTPYPASRESEDHKASPLSRVPRSNPTFTQTHARTHMHAHIQAPQGRPM